MKTEIKDYVLTLGWYVAFNSFARDPADRDAVVRWEITKPQLQTASGQTWYAAGPLNCTTERESVVAVGNILHHFSTFNEALDASVKLSHELNR